MVAWEGFGTKIAQGFAALRMRTNGLVCWAEEWMRADARYTTEPVQLLCRTLALAPACYRRFELAHAQPEELLCVEAHVSLRCHADVPAVHRSFAKSLHTMQELVVAMQRFAAAEGLVVARTPQTGVIVVSRANAGPHAVACEMRG